MKDEEIQFEKNMINNTIKEIENLTTIKQNKKNDVKLYSDILTKEIEHKNKINESQQLELTLQEQKTKLELENILNKQQQAKNDLKTSIRNKFIKNSNFCNYPAVAKVVEKKQALIQFEKDKYIKNKNDIEQPIPIFIANIFFIFFCYFFISYLLI